MFTIYRTDTGKILRISETDVHGFDEAAIAGEYDPNTFYVKRGEVLEIPPSPTGLGVFDYWLERWVEVADMDTGPIIQKRNRLLYESDWTQLPDVPNESKAAWAAYRQALRDLPSQPGYPTLINWPISPAAAGNNLYIVGAM